MKTKPLQFSIKDGKAKHCPFCNGSVGCSNYWLEDGKYKGREFWCRKCHANYRYKKYKRLFLLQEAKYNLPTYVVHGNYVHPNDPKRVYFRGKEVDNVDNIYILPCDRSGTYTSFDYGSTINIFRKLDFPITKEELEEKISLYITFS